MRTLLAALALSCLLCSTALAEELTPQKSADIKAMLAASGSSTIGVQMANTLVKQYIDILHKARPEINEQTLRTVERETIRMMTEKIDAPGGLLDRLVPVYANIYTHDEIKQILAFYQSPVGQKSLQALPTLFRESQRVGEAYGKELVPELKQRVYDALRREGVKL